MQTSLQRRNARRRKGGRGRRGGAARTAAVALPLFLFATFLAVAGVAFVGAVSAYAYYARDLDEPTALEDIAFNQQSIIYDRTGTIELARFGDERREVVTFDEISPALLDALTAVEDKTFWTNSGFDPVALGAAAIDTLQGDGRGASTLTQQLVRQRLLDPALVQDPDRTVERKIKEIIQSIRVTQAYPGLDGKKRIITAYYNQNFFGNNNYGIRAAAKDYFGVSDLNELTLAQAAILAAIPQSPSSYDLMRNAEEQEDGTLVVPAASRVVQRRNTVLDLMEQGRTPISTERGTRYTATDFDAARAEPVVLAPRVVPIWKAPHFVWAVREQLTEVLCDPGAETCPVLERGGLKIVTTLDWKLQELGERWVKAAAILPQVKDPKAYAKRIGVSYKPWMAKLRNKKIYNGALVAMDWQTGEIVTYVGSADYYAPKATKKFQPQFDVLANGWRQPGSAYKPFTYVTGIDDGSITAATMLMDVATNFARSGKAYIPTNADNLERGPVRVRSALQFSLNIPAIKSLSYIGIDRVFATSRKLGLRYLGDESQAGLSLAIGSEEVHPIDMATGYSSIANGGRYIGHTTILTVQDASGKDVISPYKPPAGEKAVSPQAAYIVTDILSGNTNPRINPVWGKFTIKSKSGERRPATLKTGTNNDAKDLNAYGFIAAPSKEGRAKGEYALTVGAWNGNSDNTVVSTPGNPVFSIDVTTYVWQGFMQAASRNWEIRDFRRPKGLKEATVDAFTGLKPGPFKGKTVREMFIDGTQPTQVDRTKVGMQIEKETGTLWQEGCVGTPVTKGFLDLSGVESGFPQWQRQNQKWIARARRGAGVGGGLDRSRTSYFYNLGSFHPYGRTWGAPFPPKKACIIGGAPVPSADPSADPTPDPSGGKGPPTP
ncbi:MAG: transglycosylase domain-containing protein [Candidatus Limnocylindrales bacterium]